MRCLLFSVILVLGAVIPAADARRGALRLMTYNLNYANPDFEKTLDAIAAADVDIVRVLDAGTSDHRPVIVAIAMPAG
jgi:endonuclease/exonuclease/phosphatase (EEP) superfamily protein YafD